MIRPARAAWAILLVFSVLVSVSLPKATAAAGIITTVAGGPGYGQGTAIGQWPVGLELAGNDLYISDTAGYLWADAPAVRALDLPTGALRAVAGTGRAGYPGDGDGGLATEAQVDEPRGLAKDSRGRLFFVDVPLVRMVDVDGTISTVAGSLSNRYVPGDGGPATRAGLYGPNDVAVDPAGNLYIAESYGQRIRKVDAESGIITTIAGTGTAGTTGDGGPATLAQVQNPGHLVFDATGNLYFTQSGRIRRIDSLGFITTVAGGGTAEPGAAVAPTELNISPNALAVDAAGSLYFTDRGFVRKVDRQGTLRTIAGDGNPVYAPAGQAPWPVTDGVPATSVSLNLPNAVAVDAQANVYVAEYRRVRKIAADGIISTVAGNGWMSVGGDGGPAGGGQLLHPRATAFDAEGNLYIADSANGRVRKVSAGTGTISTVAGQFNDVGGGDGIPATAAFLYYPSALAVSPIDQSLYIADTGNNRVRRISPQGTISTVAGVGYNTPRNGDGGPATGAAVDDPGGLAFDAAGNLYIADGGRIRRVLPNGIIDTVAGGGAPADGYGDGLPAREAALSATDVQFDQTGRMVIMDRFRQTVRRIDLDGIIRTVAGTNTIYGFSGDGGPGTEATLSLGGWTGHSGLAVDRNGAIYIADGSNGRVRKVDPDGIITTVAGDGGFGYGGDGGPALQARFNYPMDVTLDARGNLYVADAESGRIRRVEAAGGPAADAPPVPAWLAATMPSPTTTTSTTTTTLPATTTTTTTTVPTTTTTTTTVPAPATRSLASSVSAWHQPTTTPLDGLGTWIGIANDPTAKAGQVQPRYLYGHGFEFTNSTANGAVALATTPSGKVALFSIRSPNGTTYDAAVPLEWKVGQFYFPFVYQLSPGVWGAWVYDLSATTWVTVGQLSIPAAWGKLEPTSATIALWYGAPASTCAAYPLADVIFHPAIGFVGSTGAVAVGETWSTPADCTVSTDRIDVWEHYRLGSS